MTFLRCVHIPSADNLDIAQYEIAPVTWRTMANAIGADYIERVRCILTPIYDVVLVVDESGLYRGHLRTILAYG